MSAIVMVDRRCEVVENVLLLLDLCGDLAEIGEGQARVRGIAICLGIACSRRICDEYSTWRTVS